MPKLSDTREHILAFGHSVSPKQSVPPSTSNECHRVEEDKPPAGPSHSPISSRSHAHDLEMAVIGTHQEGVLPHIIPSEIGGPVSSLVEQPTSLQQPSRSRSGSDQAHRTPSTIEQLPPVNQLLQSTPMKPPDANKEPLGTRKEPNLRMDQVTTFWESYNKAADFEDREFVKALGLNLDTLLIFAGLFSGVNTAFILESLKTIQPDNSEKANDLIRSVIRVLQNSTSSHNVLHDEPFVANYYAVRSTSVFFASLCCSLTAAFGAVISKQWLNHYEREGGLKPPPDRAMERQRKFEGRDKWHLEGIIETLPTILQFSLFLFLIALVDFLWPINRTVAIVSAGFSLVPVCFYVITTLIATLYPDSPFQTRLSIYIHRLKPKIVQPFRIVAGRLTLLLPALGNVRQRLRILAIEPMLFLSDLLHSLPQPASPILPSLDDEPQIFGTGWTLNAEEMSTLNCLTFCMQRASTPQEIAAIISAFDSTPVHILGYDHSSIMTFLHAKLQLQPVWDDSQSPIWGADASLQLMIKTLHLIHVHWKLPFNRDATTITPIRRELWREFQRDPLCTESVSRIQEIMKLVESLGDEEDEDCSNSNLELLCMCLSRSVRHPWEVYYYRPYITLLSYTSTQQLLEYSRNPEYSGVAEALLSTMTSFGEEELDSDPGRGLVRATWLPFHFSTSGVTSERFSKYLEAWFTMNENREKIVSCYTQAIYELLHPLRNQLLWLPLLERDGHIQLLIRAMQIGRGSGYSDTAYYCFLTMWQAWRTVSASTPSGDSPYLSEDYVWTVAQYWVARRVFKGVKAAEIPLLVELSVEYLEQTGLAVLGTENLQLVVDRLKSMGDEYLENEGLSQALYERLERLTCN